MGTLDGQRGEPVRRRVIAAAERLLRQNRPDFSMRDLATEAGVSFATPFNQFGSKSGIMHALSMIRIDEMAARFAASAQADTAPERVARAVDIAVAVMMEEPEVNRAVMSALGGSDLEGGTVLARSAALWRQALGEGEGFADDSRAEVLQHLPDQLALAFRGALSFWTAGELADDALGPAAHGVARALLAGHGVTA
ncbi:TetR/AcrR family transcriptional regulator [Sphingosinithalassobacter portus]|uniref:TetR/AcrR family transcriptional regulator n=1 Tax=Stakelama portus TaxID=2676234 RepID=UPI000D6E80A5|nr:TetR/AcrR family transcriptional regulator [Sphingosinithalassobacter portus]